MAAAVSAAAAAKWLRTDLEPRDGDVRALRQHCHLVDALVRNRQGRIPVLTEFVENDCALTVLDGEQRVVQTVHSQPKPSGHADQLDQRAARSAWVRELSTHRH